MQIHLWLSTRTPLPARGILILITLKGGGGGCPKIVYSWKDQRGDGGGSAYTRRFGL